MSTTPEQARRETLMWRLISATFGGQDQTQGIERTTTQIAAELNLPAMVLDPAVSIDHLIQRYPELKKDFDVLLAPPVEGEQPFLENDPGDLRKTLLVSKLLLNTFGPNTQTPSVSAAQYQQWLNDVGRFEQCFGYPPGGLRGGHGAGTEPLIGADELRAGLKGMEGELVRRMALREVLADRKLADKLAPSMALVEQLLRDKANLSGEAQRNARALIQRYIAEVAEVLKTKIRQTPAGKPDRSVPPKRVFRNLDLKRTLWKNLPNFNPEDGRLYVNQLYFHRKARKTTPTRLIVVVDQSGSMVEAMVHCTILASIFAGLPGIEARLMAFDTRVIDLSPWVHDPFEVLLRTQLGGGTYIRLALLEAEKLVDSPSDTVMVLISDFYEGGSDQELLDCITAIKGSGVHFIPVGAVTSSGSYSVHPWFRTKLKELGMPILSGSITRLIEQLKAYL